MKRISDHSEKTSARDVVADVIFALPDRDLAALARQASDEVLAGAVRLMGDAAKRGLLLSAAKSATTAAAKRLPDAPAKKKRAKRLTVTEAGELQTAIVALLDSSEGRAWTAAELAEEIGKHAPRLGRAALSTYRGILTGLTLSQPNAYRGAGKRNAKFWAVQAHLPAVARVDDGVGATAALVGGDA